jgi:hypothetical protein
MTEAVYLFSQFHLLVLQEISAHLPTNVLQNLITVIKPSRHLKTVLLDVMYDRMHEREQKYVRIFPTQSDRTPKPVAYPLCLYLDRLSDMNLCRITWITDLITRMFYSSNRRVLLEIMEVLHYMENDSEETERVPLAMVKNYAFSQNNYSYELTTRCNDEMRRRITTF